MPSATRLWTLQPGGGGRQQGFPVGHCAYDIPSVFVMAVASAERSSDNHLAAVLWGLRTFFSEVCTQLATHEAVVKRNSQGKRERHLKKQDPKSAILSKYCLVSNLCG